MVLTGVFSNGVVVLDNDGVLPEGTAVQVIVKSELAEGADPKKPTLRGLIGLAGIATNLPPDFAEQHDHYIHGTPKR